ncbi:MAG: hypothetical protein ACYTF0_04430, partial [Planctomycetota bacterium]
FSQGYIHSDDNNWVGEAKGGTFRFWEATVGVRATPWNRWSFAVQLFASELGKYDDSDVALDHGFVEYNAHDALRLQVGRVRTPYGLYGDIMDVDSARTPIFLPQAHYRASFRHLLLAADGVQVLGYVDAGAVGAFEYAAMYGVKHLDEDSSLATTWNERDSYVRAGAEVEEIDSDWTTSAMLHWYTPVQGLSARLSYKTINGVEVDAGSRLVDVDVDWAMVSIDYDTDLIRVVSEASRRRQDVFAQTTAGSAAFVDRPEGYHLSLTWRVMEGLEAYGAREWSYDDDRDVDGVKKSHRSVVAVRYDFNDHWLIKAEFQDIYGTWGLFGVDNPDGIESSWQLWSLKTTVGF